MKGKQNCDYYTDECKYRICKDCSVRKSGEKKASEDSYNKHREEYLESLPREGWKIAFDAGQKNPRLRLKS